MQDNGPAVYSPAFHMRTKGVSLGPGGADIMCEHEGDDELEVRAWWGIEARSENVFGMGRGWIW